MAERAVLVKWCLSKGSVTLSEHRVSLQTRARFMPLLDIRHDMALLGALDTFQLSLKQIERLDNAGWSVPSAVSSDDDDYSCSDAEEWPRDP